MSERKWILFLIELVAALNAVSALAFMLAFWNGRDPELLQPYVLTAFILITPVWAVAVVLVVEFIKAHRPEADRWNSRGLSIGELTLLLHWCPPVVRIVAAASFLAAFAGGAAIGEVGWHGDEPFTGRHVIGFGLAAIAFCSLALPVLSSGRRMPGSFADHFGSSSRST